MTSDRLSLVKSKRHPRVSAWTFACAALALLGCSGAESSGPVPAVTGLRVAPAGASLVVGDTVRFEATIEPANAHGAVTWRVGDGSIVSVTEAGLVTARSPGATTLIATAGTVTASVAVVVSPLTDWRVDVLSGLGQRGVVGFALGDSLVVRITPPPGGAAGTLKISAAGVATTIDSLAVTAPSTYAAQLTPTAPGDFTVRVTAGDASVDVPGTAAAPARCMPPTGKSGLFEGPTPYPQHFRPLGKVRGVLLLVDFDDAPANEPAAYIASTFKAQAESWMAEASYGRMEFTLDTVARWLRLPRPSTGYGYRLGTIADSRAFQQYLADAIAAADSLVDFSRYTHYYIAPARTAAAISHTFALIMGDDNAHRADGVALRFGASFGLDVYGGGAQVNAAAVRMVHETLHTFGLPDLYRHGPGYDVSQSSAVGGWDPMSFIGSMPHVIAWHRYKMEWLDEAQVSCFDSGSLEATLTPLALPGGLKAVGVRVTPTRIIMAEVREPHGWDEQIGRPGVLVYTVDTEIPTGYEPVRVHAASRASTWGYGPLPEATYAPGRVREFVDAESGTRIEVISAVDGLYKVRLTRR